MPGIIIIINGFIAKKTSENFYVAKPTHNS